VNGRHALAAIVIALVGCPKSAPVDYTEAPRLPSPVTGSYGRLPNIPTDAVVADLVKGHTWDAYLSGGAAALALDALKSPVSLATWAIREDVWRGGYPYPIDSVKRFEGVPESPPPFEVAAWLLTVPASADVGLVRARDSLHEVWIGMVATPRVDLGVMPRSVRIGTALSLPVVPGGRYVIAEGDGDKITGLLDAGWRGALEAEGEWVFQVYDAQGLAAWFPVYVGVEAPDTNLLPAVPTPVLSAADVITLTDRYLAELRDAYGSAVWHRDMILDASARRLLAEPEATVGGVLGGLGVETPHQDWSCTAPSVEACLDAIVWDPVQRRPFMAPEYTHVGIAAAVEGPKVRIRIVLSGG